MSNLTFQRNLNGQDGAGWTWNTAPLPRFLYTGVFNPRKISGVGTNFGLLVHVLPGPNKQRAWKKGGFRAELGEKQSARPLRWF
jgi:hypothetical protein